MFFLYQRIKPACHSWQEEGEPSKDCIIWGEPRVSCLDKHLLTTAANIHSSSGWREG